MQFTSDGSSGRWCHFETTHSACVRACARACGCVGDRGKNMTKTHPNVSYVSPGDFIDSMAIWRYSSSCFVTQAGLSWNQWCSRIYGRGARWRWCCNERHNWTREDCPHRIIVHRIFIVTKRASARRVRRRTRWPSRCSAVCFAAVRNDRREWRILDGEASGLTADGRSVNVWTSLRQTSQRFNDTLLLNAV